MADKSTQLLLDALSRAAADPGGLPLYAVRMSPGLFACTSAGKPLAQRAFDEGYLRVLRTESRGKSAQPICGITEKGLGYLLACRDPRQVLEDLVRALEAGQRHTAELVAVARQTQANLDDFRAMIGTVLSQMNQPTSPPNGSPSRNGSEAWQAGILTHLAGRHECGTSGDCPLPELYRLARQAAPHLTIGQFHDGLRHLLEREQIWLHPWTGPLYDLPEPPFALLVGHEIGYYASIR